MGETNVEAIFQKLFVDVAVIVLYILFSQKFNGLLTVSVYQQCFLLTLTLALSRILQENMSLIVNLLYLGSFGAIETFLEIYFGEDLCSTKWFLCN